MREQSCLFVSEGKSVLLFLLIGMIWMDASPPSMRVSVYVRTCVCARKRGFINFFQPIKTAGKLHILLNR